MGTVSALVSASLLVVGCGRVGYSAGGQRDGGGTPPIDTGAPTDAPSDVDAPPLPDGSSVDAPAVDSSTPADSGLADSGMLDGGDMLDGGHTLDGGPVGSGCGLAAVFCDDFEGPTLVPPWGGTIMEGGTSLARTTTMTFAGGGALRADVTVDDRSAFVYAPISPAVTGPTVFMRGYFRVDTTTAHHLDLLQLNTADDSIGVIAFAGNLQVFNSFLVPGGLDPDPPFALPLARYFCLEMGVRFDTTAGVIDVWIDGARVFHVEDIQTFTTSRPVDQARAGASYAGPGQPSVTVHLDEVVVSTERIGCL